MTTFAWQPVQQMALVVRTTFFFLLIYFSVTLELCYILFFTVSLRKENGCSRRSQVVRNRWQCDATLRAVPSSPLLERSWSRTRRSTTIGLAVNKTKTKPIRTDLHLPRSWSRDRTLCHQPRDRGIWGLRWRTLTTGRLAIRVTYSLLS